MTREPYKPVALDVKATRKRWGKESAFAAAYDAMADEFAALAELARTQQRADRITLAAKVKKRRRAV